MSSAVLELDKEIFRHAEETGLEKGFLELLKIRASQINHCAFCLRMHTRDALKYGESTERISVLPAWRETGYFNEKERGALALMEAITSISDGQVPDETYHFASASLNEKEIAAVEWLGVMINSWNRIAISGRTPVAP